MCLHPPGAAGAADRRGQAAGQCAGGGIDEVYPHCPKAFLRGAVWKPEQWLPADAQPTSAEVTLAQLREPGLTIADIERTEDDALRYRYE